jgi:hypothetical protein
MDEQIVESGIGELRTRVGNLERGLATNSAATARVEANTEEIVELFKSWKGAMKVLEIIGKAAKPLAAIASLSAALGAWWFNFRAGK